MNLIKLKATTNGTRHQINIQKNLLSKTNRLLKKNQRGIKNQSGRSSLTGRITVRHKGGACKNLYRIINFKNTFYNAIVVSVLYDPNRTAFISLNYSLNEKIFFYTLATDSIYAGSFISCDSENNELKLGFRTLLKNIPTGSLIHSLSLNNKTKYIRSAGTFGQLVQKDLNFCQIKLPSNKIIKIASSEFATIGILSNIKHNLVTIGKAGRNRLKGVRPAVRGIAMNPVDHPHGGRTNGGMPSVTPWGIPTKGKPTVKHKK